MVQPLWIVIPAKAGIQISRGVLDPAFSGVTVQASFDIVPNNKDWRKKLHPGIR